MSRSLRSVTLAVAGVFVLALPAAHQARAQDAEAAPTVAKKPSAKKPSSPAPRPLKEIRADVREAARTYADARLEALVKELAGRVEAKPELTTQRAWLRATFHWANLLRYRRTLEEHPDGSAFKDRQIELASKAEDVVEKLTEKHPKDVDLRVLRGEFIALQISGPNGALLGPRAATQIEKALELAPSDPNAHLASGRRYMYTPGAFGGSDSKGLKHLKAAEKTLNGREREAIKARRGKVLEGVKDNAEKIVRMRALVAQVRREVWGAYEEVLVQLAVVYRRLGRDRRARVALKRALATNPDSQAATLLLARLDGATSK